MRENRSDTNKFMARPEEEHSGSTTWITHGSLTGAALRLALPMVGAMVLHNLFYLIDMYFVGILGSAAIAAVGMSLPALNLVYVIVMGITTGCTALVAQAIGSGRKERAQNVAGQSLLLAAGLSVLAAGLGVPLARRFLVGIGAGPEVADLGTPYLAIMAGFSFALTLSITFSAAIRGAGDTKTPLKIMGAGIVLNIILDPILIFGSWRVPAMGVTGSAVASVISQMVVAAWLARLFFWQGHAHFKLRLAHLWPQRGILRQLFRVGVFSSGETLIRNLSAVALVWIVAGFGKEAVAAFTIGIRLWMIVVMVGIGFGIAAATLVGQNLGAGRPDRAQSAGWLTAGMYAAIALVIGIVFFTLGESLVGCFTGEPRVLAIGRDLMRWLAVTVVFLAVSVVLGRAMGGAGATLRPMIITGIATLAVGVPMAYFLAHAWGSERGIWFSMVVSSIIHAVFMVLVYQRGRWRTTSQRFIRPAGEAERESEEAHDDAV